jgi:hypothetical protein
MTPKYDAASGIIAGELLIRVRDKLYILLRLYNNLKMNSTTFCSVFPMNKNRNKGK